MKKTAFTLITVAVVGLSSTFFTDFVHADTINELHIKQSKIQSERLEIKENLSVAEAEIADVLIDLKEINEEIIRVEGALEENQAILEKAKDKIAKTEEEIEVFELEIIELENNIKIRSDMLKQRISSYQKSGGEIAYLDVLLGSKDFGEFISRLSAVTKITSSDTELIKKQEEDKAEVEKRQNKVKEKLAEQKEMKVELQGMKALILDQKQYHEDSRRSIEKKEKRLKKLKVDLVSKDNNFATLETEIRQDIAAQGTGYTSTSTSNDSSPAVSSVKSSPKQVAGGGGLSTAINAGYQHLGTPYRWAGKGPGGFDCSGFVSWAYGQAGYSLPSSTSGLSGVGQKVSYSNIQPGDLVFFNTYKTNGHVGIYVGGGNFIGSQNSTGLAVASMNSVYWKDAFKGHVRRAR